MVLGPFAETKGPRLPGRDPATEENYVDMGIRDLSMGSPASNY